MDIIQRRPTALLLYSTSPTNISPNGLFTTWINYKIVMRPKHPSINTTNTPGYSAPCNAPRSLDAGSVTPYALIMHLPAQIAYIDLRSPIVT